MSIRVDVAGPDLESCMEKVYDEVRRDDALTVVLGDTDTSTVHVRGL